MKLRKSKKGTEVVPKSAGEAGMVIGLIAVIIIFYILFLPPADRAELLGEEVQGTGTSPAPGQIAKVLLEQNIGSLQYYNARPAPHTMSGVSLFAESESRVLNTINAFRVRNGWFEKESQKINFVVPDLEHTDEVLLTFDATMMQGPLLITLNNNPVYNYVPETANIGPISLPKNLLQETNTLEVSVGSVAWKFWTTNEYAIQQGKIIAEVVDVNKQQSSRSFSITEQEKINMETAMLIFLPRCNQQEVGNLEIVANGRRIYNAVPDCRALNTQELFADELMAGKNDLHFRTNRGEYEIEQLRVEVTLKEAQPFVQYFQIDPDADQLLRSGRRAFAEIIFVDDGKEKRGEISINGRLTFIAQTASRYTQRIDGFLTAGNNYIELRPEPTMHISSLKIFIQ